MFSMKYLTDVQILISLDFVYPVGIFKNPFNNSSISVKFQSKGFRWALISKSGNELMNQDFYFYVP